MKRLARPAACGIHPLFPPLSGAQTKQAAALTRPPVRRLHQCLVVSLLSGLFGWMALAQSGLGLPKGRFTHFIFPEYHDPPHERQLKSTLKGVEALPQPGGLLRIQGLRVDTFEMSGEAGFVIEAEDCDYSMERSEAWSAGPIRLRTADERFSLEGFGFHWQGAESVLTISNRVHTVLRGGLRPLSTP